MGTQFSSRLTVSHSRQVVARLLLVRDEGTKGKSGGVQALSPAERRQVGDAMVREVLSIAEDRRFSSEFAGSGVFLEVLDWVKSRHSDARFKGCRQTIKVYELDKHPRPIPVLARALRELTGAKKNLRDPFRVSSSAAAQGVLAAVAARALEENGNLSETERFCRRLASFSLEEIVSLFVRLFVNDFLERIMHRADPKERQSAVADARRLTGDSAQRIGRRVVQRVKKAGALNDSKRIREILLEVLEELVDKKKAA